MQNYKQILEQELKLLKENEQVLSEVEDNPLPEIVTSLRQYKQRIKSLEATIEYIESDAYQKTMKEMKYTVDNILETVQDNVNVGINKAKSLFGSLKEQIIK